MFPYGAEEAIVCCVLLTPPSLDSLCFRAWICHQRLRSCQAAVVDLAARQSRSIPLSVRFVDDSSLFIALLVYQGRRPYMEDRFLVVGRLNGLCVFHPVQSARLEFTRRHPLRDAPAAAVLPPSLSVRRRSQCIVVRCL